ncbi:Metal-dependent hydrolase HDOD [Nitrosococcus halophilus Nc 4]|uniref:Metal-dependent hydrolase HDOD n=1 Tax=Nitrosococcus halophilus (strain Nc4) TaxID=472759 RepID=D5BX22_NITHN|nr:Metal-dependent hydrolase HDOD [Nitrosococcus halophilus Nc 4]
MAHQVLYQEPIRYQRPEENEVIQIEQFCTEILEDLNNNHLVLPTLPEVALKIREVVDDPNTSAADVAKIIVTDTALSARLIKIANSPLYRGRHPIDNVQMALARLGITLVRNLVTSLVMEQIFQATSESVDRRMRKLWEQSTQVAAIAYVLATQIDKFKADEALLGGLIHQIGSLPILMRAEDTPELLENETMLDEIITQLSSPLGKAILHSWHFPSELVAVTAEHNNLQRNPKPEPDLVDVVIVAKLQSNLEDMESHEDWHTIPALAKLGFSTDISVINLEENEAEIREVKAMLGG